jgi:hypothetical protein
MSFANTGKGTGATVEETAWADNRSGQTNKPTDKSNILSIAGFLFSVLLISWFGGSKATYWYLLVVLAGVAFTNAGKYSVSVGTPEILKGA